MSFQVLPTITPNLFDNQYLPQYTDVLGQVHAVGVFGWQISNLAQMLQGQNIHLSPAQFTVFVVKYFELRHEFTQPVAYACALQDAKTAHLLIPNFPR